MSLQHTPQNTILSHQKSLLEALQTLSQRLVLPQQMQPSLGRTERHGVPKMLFALDQFQFEWGALQSQTKKFSEYRYQLKERTKLGVFYGNLATRMVSRLLSDSQSHGGNYQRQLLSVLEQRLDVVIFRSHLVKSMKTAQQFIAHGHILVNHHPVTIPSYRLAPGDIVSFTPHVLASRHDRFRDVLKHHRERGQRDQVQGETFHRFVEQTSRHGESPSCDLHLLQLILAQKIASRIVSSISPSSESVIHNLHYTHVNPPKDATRGYTTPKGHTSLKRAFRNQLIELIWLLQGMDVPRHLMLLYINTAMVQLTLRSRIQKVWWFLRLKPVHLEISYALSRIIYLYAPQRVAYPFSLQLDDIRRSF